MTVQLSGIEQAAVERLVMFAEHRQGERRTEPRTSIQIPAWIEFLGDDRERVEGPLVALVQDVSPSGIGLICEDIPTLDYHLIYVDAGDSYAIEGIVEVVRCERRHGYCCLGGRFID
ncbi:MAG: PilZ domain-containing protein [Pirellulaceae bacterium]|jgi:hypothetical protein|nr:PilZ domain-containing protein [Pirellulaceae bacterium]MDP7016654.1 PilZ domain-containing protein [Pirellulaceae bacterium]